MRFPTPLLVLPLLVGQPNGAAVGAPVQSVDAKARVAADSIPVSVRWNRLVPRFVEDDAASRRAARKAAAAAGDSAALRRIAMTTAAVPVPDITTLEPGPVRSREFRARQPRDVRRGGHRQRHQPPC